MNELQVNQSSRSKLVTPMQPRETYKWETSVNTLDNWGVNARVILADGAWRHQDGKGVATWVFQHSNDITSYWTFTSAFLAPSAFYTEARAVLEALMWAQKQGWTAVKIYTDYKLVVDACNSLGDCHFAIQSIISDIITFIKKISCSVLYVK